MRTNIFVDVERVAGLAMSFAQSLGKTFGISVVKEALLAADHGVTAMHDPTEGGIAMGLYEMASASGLCQSR